jgi:uncharacterized protein with HEPN domain
LQTDRSFAKPALTEICQSIRVIAEAARRVSTTTQQMLPTISWQEINGMRNRLVHEYDAVNLTIVWDTVQFTAIPGRVGTAHIFQKL